MPTTLCNNQCVALLAVIHTAVFSKVMPNNDSKWLYVCLQAQTSQAVHSKYSFVNITVLQWLPLDFCIYSALWLALYQGHTLLRSLVTRVASWYTTFKFEAGQSWHVNLRQAEAEPQQERGKVPFLDSSLLSMHWLQCRKEMFVISLTIRVHW